jgi:glycosyltransferase involved in cell wall biosynthesis
MGESENENVTVITNAPGSVLQEQLDQASIYWHATGFEGQAVAAQQEHFGIATVEAMAAGAFPVFIDRAGQREIFTNGVDGYRWSTRIDLITATIRLVGDHRLLAQMSTHAKRRAEDFSEKAFRRRLKAVISRLENARKVP